MGKTVKVTMDMRDSGAHLNASKDRLRGGTVTRIRGTTSATKSLAGVKAPYDEKTAVIRAKMLPMGAKRHQSTTLH